MRWVESGKRVTGYLGLVITVITVSIAGVLGGALIREYVLSSADWKIREVAGLLVDSPDEFQPFALSTQQASELAEAVRKHGISDRPQVYDAKGDDIDVTVAQYHLLEGTQFSLDSAASGAISQMASQPEVKSHTQSRSYVVVSGIEGIHVSRRFDTTAGVLRVEALIFCRNLSCWNVQVLFRGSTEDGEKTAGRVLASVEIAS